MSEPLSGLPARVTICEVGPRDGLQNEANAVSSADKIRYIDLLSGSGLSLIETTSFVSPKAIPQMADAEEVMARIERRPGVRYLTLVPNLRGLERARLANVDSIAVFTAASNSFTQRNIRMSIDESLAVFSEVVREAKRDGIWVRGYISTSFGCPYEGEVPVGAVVRVADALAQMGCDEISVGDTVGVGVPSQVVEIVRELREHVPIERLAMHFHDTRGTALANVLAALETGITIFDSSSGGLGGCPYAPGATGNLATEDLLYLLHGMKIETGVDLNAVVTASQFLATSRGRAPDSRCYAAVLAQRLLANPAEASPSG